MKRKLSVLFVVVLIALLAVVPASAAGGTQGRGTAGVIYVTSQGLYYDTYTVVDPLPFHGPFQQLVNGTTEFGPGQPGYLSTDHYFLCPLLGPGRTSP